MDTDYLYAQLVAFTGHEDCYPRWGWGRTYISLLPPKERVAVVTLGSNSECSTVIFRYLSNQNQLDTQKIEESIHGVYRYSNERTKLCVMFLDIQLPDEPRDCTDVYFHSSLVEKLYKISMNRQSGGGKKIKSAINVQKFDPTFDDVLPFAMTIFGFPAFKPLIRSGRPSGVNRLFLEEAVLFRAVAKREFAFVFYKLMERRPSTEEADIEFLRGDQFTANMLSRAEAEERAYLERLESSEQTPLD